MTVHDELIGEQVRWRRDESQRWTYATVTGINRDGSLHVRTQAGKPRDLRPEQVEHQIAGPRGGQLWEPLTA